jgi:hypothetical protein
MIRLRTGRLKLVPCSLRWANAYVDRLHRHHGPTRGHKFSVAVGDEDANIRGVAIVGRPVARPLDDGFTVEVLRVCTDGCPNACSFLYGASWRAAKALGHTRILTYTLASEPGTSLIAAGWVPVATVPGRSWSCPSRPRVDKHPTEDKIRWEPAA